MSQATFIGRARELRQLDDHLLAVASRRASRVVAVTGAAGIGKTRLVVEFRDRTARRARWLAGHAAPATSAVLLATVRQAMPDPPANQRQAIERLAALAAETPVVLWIDDLQLADGATQELVNHLGRNPLPGSLLVLTTLRLDALATSAPLALNIGTLLKDGLATEVRVPPLSASELNRMAELALGPAALTAELAAWLADRTRGNALMLSALLEDLARDPSLRSAAETVQERTRTLLVGLPIAAQKAAEVAAVIGSRFPASSLLAAEPAAGPGLDRLVAAGLLVEDPASGQLEFAHPILQEAVYAMAGPARRTHLHRLLADRLPLPQQLRAYHLARGALPGDAAAIATLRTAAAEALSAGAASLAVVRLEDALALAPASAPRLRAALLDELAGAADGAGDHTAGVPALRELLQLAGDGPTRATTRLRLASFLSAGTGEIAEAERHVQEAVAICRAEAPDRLASALNELGWVRGEGGDLEGQVRSCREALELAEDAGDQRVQLHALGPLTHALMLLGRESDAEAVSSRATDIARSLGDRTQEDWHLSVRSEVLASRGELGAAIALVEPLAGAEREAADVVHSNLVRHLWLAGRWADALIAARRLLATSPPQVPVRTAWALTIGGAIEAASGRQAAARPLLALADRSYRGQRFYCFSAWHDWAAGIAEWLLGNPEAALGRLQRSVEWLEEMQAVAALAFVLPDLCQIAVISDHREVAEAAAARAALLVDTRISKVAEAAASACDAFLGVKPARRSAGAAERAGLHFLSARVLASGAVDDIGEAARRFAAMPAPELERQCRERLRGGGEAGRRVARATGSLTPREADVVALARRGLSAPSIARSLGISERTVESHLAHIYSKLGIAGRRQLDTVTQSRSL